MFKPFFITDNFESRVVSIYRAGIALNSGALVDIDTTDTTPIQNSVGYNSLIGGSLKLATVTGGTGVFPRELGIAMVAVTAGGMPLIERVLGISNAVFTIPEGMNAAVYKTAGGDIIGTTEYVGYLAGDAAATGRIDTTANANYGAAVEIYQGRYRLVQGTNAVRGRFLGNTTANGVALGLFEIA